MRFSALFLCLLSCSVFATFNDDSLHVGWMNKQVAPGQNFDAYANGNWKLQNPIPNAYPVWNGFMILNQQNQVFLHTLVENLAKNPNLKPGSDEQKIGDFYYSGMDEAAIEKAGFTPLLPEFAKIQQIKNQMDLLQELAHLQLLSAGGPFEIQQVQDLKNSEIVTAEADQGGLGLPDRDYYLQPDAHFQQIRALYVKHIAAMLQLLGDNPTLAATEAQTVMRIETNFAQASMPLAEQRNPTAVYHLMNLAQLQKLTPNFAWDQFLSALGYPHISQINIAEPAFFTYFNTQLTAISLADWKTYLRWQLIHNTAALLSTPFVTENFHFRAALYGMSENLPRWQRVLSNEDDALGFALGKMYVAQKFSAADKQMVMDMIGHIRTALEQDLTTLAWMTPATRTAALQKLALMTMRVGYPDKWRDYSGLTIDRGPYVLNVLRAHVFLNQHELNKIGKPVDRNEWEITPQTINAYYNDSMNNLNIPAGILQPPFFSPKAPAAVNYGAMGMVIGHEMTHAFDDTGAQFDGHGNLKNWWVASDLAKFQIATTCISQQFSNYIVAGNTHLQGKLVIGEATADLGGVILANRALHAVLAKQPSLMLEGFTPDQQFFISFAHLWATNARSSYLQSMATTDPHPDATSRVNGTLFNVPAFEKAFALPNANPKPCVIW